MATRCKFTDYKGNRFNLDLRPAKRPQFGSRAWVVEGRNPDLYGGHYWMGVTGLLYSRKACLQAIADYKAFRAAVTVGLTGPDWEPTEATKMYAQHGDKFAFGRTDDEAVDSLYRIYIA